MLITAEQILAILPRAQPIRVAADIGFLHGACALVGINTPLRLAAFIAQVGVECDQFHGLTEYASGKAYDTGRLAKKLGNTPEADGDGEKFKGRGGIGLTGHDNYVLFREWLRFKGIDVDVVAHPERVADPDLAYLAAAFYWEKHNLNALADKGTLAAFRAMTHAINGGQNGAATRERFWANALKVFGLKAAA